jgi:tetratricopeptide (TPR) repeat protein
MNSENINKILELGKQAVVELNQNKNLEKFEENLEQGFQFFTKLPDEVSAYSDLDYKFRDLGYRIIKMAVKGHLENNNFNLSKKWLDRWSEFSKMAQLDEEEVDFYCGRYFYEIGDFDEAYNQWREVVRRSGKSHFRFFEGEDKKYLEFYKSQTKLREKK